MAERERENETEPGETRTTVQAEEQRRRDVESHQARHPEEFAGRGRETDEARESADEEGEGLRKH